MGNKQKIVVIDARMIGPILHGVARYVSLMIKGLAEVQQLSGLSYEPVFLVSKALSLPFRSIQCSASFLSGRELYEIPKTLKELGADLYHSTSFSSLLYCPCPSILTVHDLNHLHFGNLAKKFYYLTLLKRFMKRSSALITVSEFSRNEISNWLGKSEREIDVVYNAIEPQLFKDFTTDRDKTSKIIAKYGLVRDKYFLCLGNPKPHKNLKLLVQAYQEFKQQRGSAEGWPLALTINGESKNGVICLGATDQDDTPYLMAGASALFSPSLYEGFGLPPVESVAVGTPVVASQIPPHREGLSQISPGEVCWVEAKDFHGWVNAFHKAQRGELFRPSPESRHKTETRFSPLVLGKAMDQIYRKILEQRGLAAS